MNAMPADWGRTASRWGRSRRTAPVVPPPGAPRPAAFCARARMSSRKSQPGGPPCEVADSATRYPVLVGPSLSRRCSRGGSVGKRISLLTCCAVLALLGSTSRLAAQGGVIRGRVTDSTGAALGRVSVTIEALGARATTDDHGNYELRSVPAGSHTVRVRLLGYVPLLVRQSVTDANDIVRPFTLRGLSPDQTLVLVNGWRRHQTALVNTFPYGMAFGSSGVDMNAIPGGAIERLEVLRDGASAQYGSDAIAGVVNVVMREGKFSPYLNADAGRYVTQDYPDDGTTVDVNGGGGIGLGRGSLSLFGEFQHRDKTNRAWPDSTLVDANGVNDVIDPNTGQILEKRNSLAKPTYHWGDGLEKDAMTFANFRMPLTASGSSEVYAFGGYSNRVGTGNGFWR